MDDRTVQGIEADDRFRPGEFHLRTLKWRIENNDKLPIEFYEPKIPYRETITKAARADYRHKNSQVVRGSSVKFI